MFTTLEKNKLAQAIKLFGLYSAGALFEFRAGHTEFVKTSEVFSLLQGKCRHRTRNLAIAAAFTFLRIYNNNSNNIYLLQLGCNPVAVVMLHVYKT